MIGIALVILLIFKNIFYIFYQLILQWLRAKLVTEYRQYLFKHIINLDFHYYDQKSSGSVYAIIMDDIQIFNKLIQGAGRYLILNGIICIGLITSLCMISIKLTLITLSGTVLIGAIIGIISNYLKKKAAIMLSLINIS